MTTLTLIWTTALVLIAVSVLVLAWLVSVRAVREAVMRRREHRRRELLDLMLTSVGNPVIAERAAAAGARHPRVVVYLASQLLALVRGSEQERLLELFIRMGLPDELRRRLRRGSQRQRIMAAELLVHFDGAPVLQALGESLDDPSAEVRTAAALSLAEKGEIGDARAVLERIWRGAGWTRRLLDIMIRLMRDQPGAIVAIARDRAIEMPVRAMAIEAIGRSGSLDLWSEVEALSGEADAELAAQALRALGSIGHPGGEPAVVRALSHPSWDVRAAAAEAAGRLQIETVAPRLIGLLEDDNWWVRLRAGAALADMGTSGAALLRTVAQGPHNRSQRMAALVMAERGIEA